MKRFHRGLVVGKFAPLHRGHEFVIRRACEDCEEVLVLSYSRPELPGCEPVKREKWLAELFPQTRRLIVTQDLLNDRLPGTELPPNEAPDQVHRRFVGQVCYELLGVPSVDAVFTSEDYGDGFAEELTAFFRQRTPSAPFVKHMLVDRERANVPISGSALRADIHNLREWLSPGVYASFVERVCLLGGESSGKSTLAIALAQQLRTASVPEYGRELWESRNGVLYPEDMLHIAATQIAREEEAARRAERYLFCDTSPLTTLFYSRDLFGFGEPELERLAGRRYAMAVLCAPDFPFVQDGTRRDSAFRQRQHEWYVKALANGDQPWMVVGGTVEERVRTVSAALAASVA